MVVNDQGYNTSYSLSVQADNIASWLEILNNRGSGKGVFFGVWDQDFELYNYNGADTGNINFYIQDEVKWKMVGTNGNFQIMNMNAGVVQASATGVLSSNTINTGFNKSLGTDAGTVSEGNHNHGLAGSILDTTTAQTVSNKTFVDADTYFSFTGGGDRKMKFQLSMLPSSTTVTLYSPTASTTLVGRDTTDTLLNKTLTSPVISSISNTGTLTLPTDTTTLVGTDTTDTLTNKSINSDNNTITNIANADIKASAAIDATKIANGSVTNAEFQYLALVTSDIQTQLDSKGWTRSGSNVMLATSSDHVGIGVTPSNFFEVRNTNVGGGNHVQLIVYDTQNVDTYNLGVDTSDSSGIVMSTEDATYRQAVVFCADGGTNSTTFGVSTSTNSGSSWNPRLVVKVDGKVGINKNNPGQALDVVGNIAVSGTVDGVDVAGHEAATSVHGVSGNVVGTTSTQTLTNKTINTASNTITIATGDITSGTMADARIAQSNVTQHEGAITHDNLTGVSANDHVDHTSVSITAGEALSGGGTIAATRTIDLDINSLSADASPNGAADYVVTYDADAGSHKKVLLNNLPGAGSGETNTASNVGTAGVGVFKQKTGVDMEFKKINAGSNKVTITDDTGNSEIDVDVTPGNIDINDLANAPAGTVVGHTDTITLTNKSIDSDNNTITNIANADIKAGAAIDAAKLANGTVSNTEYQYLNGATSNIQTQLDAIVFGTQYQTAASDTESTTTSTTLQNKTTLTTGSLPSGTYRLGYAFELSNASNGVLSEVEVRLDGTEVALTTFEADNDFHSLGGFVHQSLSGVVTATIKYRVQTTGTAKIRRARLELWRVS